MLRIVRFSGTGSHPCTLYSITIPYLQCLASQADIFSGAFLVFSWQAGILYVVFLTISEFWVYFKVKYWHLLLLLFWTSFFFLFCLSYITVIFLVKLCGKSCCRRVRIETKPFRNNLCDCRKSKTKQNKKNPPKPQKKSKKVNLSLHSFLARSWKWLVLELKKSCNMFWHDMWCIHRETRKE